MHYCSRHRRRNKDNGLTGPDFILVYYINRPVKTYPSNANGIHSWKNKSLLQAAPTAVQGRVEVCTPAVEQLILISTSRVFLCSYNSEHYML